MAVRMFYENFQQTSDEEFAISWLFRYPCPGSPEKGSFMRNRLVPRTEWHRFFRDFSRRHEDWLVTVRIVSSALGDQVESSDLPLEGIDADPAGHGPISIHMGRSPQRHVEHEVENPTQIWVELSEEGAEKAL